MSTTYTFPSDADMWLAAAALRFAARTFDADAERMRTDAPHLVAAFQDQAARARRMSVEIEQAAS